MIKRILTAIAILPFTLSMAYANTCVEPHAVKNSTALVKADGVNVASAVLYDADIAITTAHTVRDKETISVYAPLTGENYQATVIHSAVRPDLAILKLESPVAGAKPITLARKVLPNEPLHAASFAFARKDRLGTTTARFNTFARFKSDTRLLYLNAALTDWAYGGDNGGGLYNCKGQLVGLLFGNMAMENLPDYAYAINFRALEDALKAAKIPARRPY